MTDPAPTPVEPHRDSGWSLPLGRIGGVPIRAHITLVLLLALIAGAANDHHRSAVSEVAWVVCLFACVLAHELAHARVARRKGIAVHEIELLPFGGVSKLDHVPDAWRDELAIAVAGPATSLVVAASAAATAWATGTHLWPPGITGVGLLSRLAWVNLLLAGFNLVPAFPMDGGRVLRALLQRSSDRLSATRTAARVGRFLAVTFIAIGLLADIWLVVIGVFVLLAGKAEELSVLAEARRPRP